MSAFEARTKSWSYVRHQNNYKCADSPIPWSHGYCRMRDVATHHFTPSRAGTPQHYRMSLLTALRYEDFPDLGLIPLVVLLAKFCRISVHAFPDSQLLVQEI